MDTCFLTPFVKNNNVVEGNHFLRKLSSMDHKTEKKTLMQIRVQVY